jgi:hypothetical protein
MQCYGKFKLKFSTLGQLHDLWMYRHSPSLFNHAICTERCACAGTIYSRLGPNGNSLSRTGVTAGICFTRNCYCQPPCNTGPCHTGGTSSSGGSTSTGTPTSRSSSTDTPTSESSGPQPGNDAGTTPSRSQSGKSGGHCFNIAPATLETAKLEGAACSHYGNGDMWCCGRYCYTPEHLTTGSCPMHLRSLRHDVEAWLQKRFAVSRYGLDGANKPIRFVN